MTKVSSELHVVQAMYQTEDRIKHVPQHIVENAKIKVKTHIKFMATVICMCSLYGRMELGTGN
jgi:hypothetical protein